MVMAEGAMRRPIKIIKREVRLPEQASINEPSEATEQKMTAKDHVKASQEILQGRKQADHELLERWRRAA